MGAALHPLTDNLQPQFRSVENMYLGESFSFKNTQEVKEFCSSKYSDFNISIKSSITPRDAASLLLNGKILGRVSGRMEFGARALGNRSIFALPDSWKR